MRCVHEGYARLKFVWQPCRTVVDVIETRISCCAGRSPTQSIYRALNLDAINLTSPFAKMATPSTASTSLPHHYLNFRAIPVLHFTLDIVYFLAHLHNRQH